MIWCYNWPRMERAIRVCKQNPGYFNNRPFSQWVAIRPENKDDFVSYVMGDDFWNSGEIKSIEFVREAQVLMCRIVAPYKDLVTVRDNLDLFGNHYWMEVVE